MRPVSSSSGRAASSAALEECVDAAAVAQLPDFADSADDSGEVFAVDVEQIPRSLQRDDKSVKMMIRSHGLSLQREERRHFWRGMLVRREGDEQAVEATAGLYWETVKTCFGTTDLPSKKPHLPGCVDHTHINSYCLSLGGQISVARIITCFTYNSPDVQHCPMLFPLAAVLRHYLPEDDTYALISSLASSRQPKFLTQSKAQIEVDWRTVLELQKLHNKKIFKRLISEFGNEAVESLVQDWLWWLFDYLPLPHVVRIVDCFLVEGQKLLFRCALALVRQFAKYIKNKEWKAVLTQKGLRKTFTLFCKEIPVAPFVVLDRGFRFRNLSTANIGKLSLTIEIHLKAQGFKAVPRKRSVSSDNLPTPHSIKTIQAVSDTLSYKQLITIWHWLPARMTTVNPTLAYSSDVHGISMTTFYARAELYEQTILVIKTTNDEIFGAYCSASWAERNFKDDKGLRQRYFGTGESFLFKLANRHGEKAVRYQWVNLHGSAGDAGLSKAEEHARELFMSGQLDMFAIGGGDGTAIYVDSSMTFGKTERCATFNNPPLCKSGDFQIAVLEVYGLNPLDL